MSSTPVPSSRVTLSYGGVGVALASLVPLVLQAALVLPPSGSSWWYDSWRPLLGPVSAAVSVAAFVVLALGARHEQGIAGASLLGKIALIVFPVPGLVLSVLAFAPLRTLSAGDYLGTSDLGADSFERGGALYSAAYGAAVVLGLVALVVAAVVVFRAGVVRGTARWALPVLAAVTAITLVLAHIPDAGLAEGWRWGVAVVPSIQLVTGVLYARGGQMEVRRRRLLPVPVPVPGH